MRLFGDLSLSKEFASEGSFDETFEISVIKGTVQVQGPSMNAKLLQLALRHVDNLLLRASELNNHFLQELLYVTELSPLDALTVLQ